MSFLVTRPPVPVPGISAISTPCSSARRRTTGEERVRRRVSAPSIWPRPLPSLSAETVARCPSVRFAAGWASVPEAGNSSVGESAATFSCGGASAAWESLSSATSAISVPTSTVEPSETRNFSIVPATGEGNSALTLSVSTSARGSSISTSSPSDLSQRVMVPSVTLSPSCGIVTGLATDPPLVARQLEHGFFYLPRRWHEAVHHGAGESRRGHVRCPEAHHGPIEPLERLARHDGRYLSRNRSRQVSLGDHQYLAGLLRRVQDLLPVQRIKCSRLYDLGLYTVLFGELLGYFQGHVEHESVGDDRDLRALAVDAGLAEGDLVIFVGNLLFYEAVGTFVFEEEDRVRVADGALYHGLGVGGERGRDHLEAWCIAEPGFDALGVVEGTAGHDTVGSPDGYGAIPVPVRAVVELGRLVDDLVERRRDEVSELYLGNRAHPVNREAYGRAHDQALSQRRVHHPRSTEFLLQPLRDPENTAGPAYVLAEHHYRLVRAHLLGEPLVDGLEQILRGHRNS